MERIASPSSAHEFVFISFKCILFDDYIIVWCGIRFFRLKRFQWSECAIWVFGMVNAQSTTSQRKWIFISRNVSFVAPLFAWQLRKLPISLVVLPSKWVMGKINIIRFSCKTWIYTFFFAHSVAMRINEGKKSDGINL